VNNEKLRIVSFFVVVMLASIVFIPAASAAADKASTTNPSDSKIETYSIKGFDAQKVKGIEDEAARIRNMPSTIMDAPYIGLVTADDQTKKTVLGYIDKLSVSNSEKKEMKKAIKDIWARVPDGITEKDYPEIQKIGDAVTKYVYDTYWADQISPMWAASTHSDLIYYGVKVYAGNNFVPQLATYAANSANLPDTDSSIDPGIYGSYNHYYNPYALFGLGFGGAPGRCKEYANYAKSDIKLKQYDRAYNNLGIASHYLSDVSQPMHTSGEYQQGLDHIFGNQYHIKYETYVGNNWVSGRNYRQKVTEVTTMKSISDPSASVKSLAKFSNPYYALLWKEITNKPDNFDTDNTQIITIITNQEAVKYNAGLVGYINRL
jgi:hypothetical protein